MTFFSTAERLSIGGLPFVVPDEKPTRREALAYYRMAASHFDLPVRQYETVERVERLTEPAATGHGDRAPRFAIHSRTRTGIERLVHAHAICVATGYFGRPNRLGVPGEELPHVRHGYVDGHYAWREPVVVVGGGNSAVDAALELYRAEARVQLVHFEAEVDARVKPWVRPIIQNRLADGSIVGHFGSRVVAIDAESVTITGPEGERVLPATQVYLMTGYLPETGVLEALGVPIHPETGVPAHDPVTMATPVPGVYLAGVIASGFDANRIFIENGRDHGDAIVAHLLAATSPAP